MPSSRPRIDDTHDPASSAGSDGSHPRIRLRPKAPVFGKDGARDAGAPQIEITSSEQRIAELEIELAEARASAKDSEHDAATFDRTIERLAYSERVVRQTTTKLIETEEQLSKAETCSDRLSLRVGELEAAGTRHTKSETELRREIEAARARELDLRHTIEQMTAEREAKNDELEAAHEWTSRALAQEKSLRELAESLSRDLAASTSDCANVQESCEAAQAREQQALERALHAESSCSAAAAEIAKLRARDAEFDAAKLELQQSLDEREQELNLARKQLATFEREHERFLAIFNRVESLSHEIIEAGLEARTRADQSSASDAESDRVTLVPGAAPDAAPRRRYDSAAPEIVVDGVALSSHTRS